MSLPLGYVEALASLTCSNCGASRCRLWRRFQADDVALFCSRCLAVTLATNDVESLLDADTRYSDWCFGWWVPAVLAPYGVAHTTPSAYRGPSTTTPEELEAWLSLPFVPRFEHDPLAQRAQRASRWMVTALAVVVFVITYLAWAS